MNIRGTSGSGKSTLVRELMDAHGGVKEWTGLDPTKKRPIPSLLGYGTFDRQVGIVGPYRTACGGCDGVGTQDEIQRRVNVLGEVYRYVVFEGLLVSHLYVRYAEQARQYAAVGRPFVFAILDTPLDVCLHRVQVRRDLSGNVKPFNPKNTIQKWHDVDKVRIRAQEEGFMVRVLRHESAYEDLYNVMQEPF